MTAPKWTVVIPLKASARAKTRLALPPAQRRTWARAFAVDTVAAAVDCPLVRRVVVVTDDAEWTLAPPSGATVIVVTAPVNAAIRHAVADDRSPVAVRWREPTAGCAPSPTARASGAVVRRATRGWSRSWQSSSPRRR